MKVIFVAMRSEMAGSGTISNGTSARRPARCRLTIMKWISTLQHRALPTKGRRSTPAMLMTTSGLLTMSQSPSEGNDSLSAFKEAFPIMTFGSGDNFLWEEAVMASVWRYIDRVFGLHDFCCVL